VLVAGGDVAGSAPHVARSLAEGPELSRHEGRLAQAEVAVASGDAGASRIVTEALALAEKGGHLLGARRLAELKAGL